MDKIKLNLAFIWSASITVVFIAMITILGELYSPLKDALKNTFTHHWIGKSVLSAGLFVLLSLLILILPVRDKKELVLGSLTILIVLILLSSLSIFGLFVFESLR